MAQTLFGNDDGGSWRDLARPPAPLWPVACYAAGGSVSAVLIAISSVDDVFPALLTLWLTGSALFVWIGWSDPALSQRLALSSAVTIVLTPLLALCPRVFERYLVEPRPGVFNDTPDVVAMVAQGSRVIEVVVLLLVAAILGFSATFMVGSLARVAPRLLERCFGLLIALGILAVPCRLALLLARTLTRPTATSYLAHGRALDPRLGARLSDVMPWVRPPLGWLESALLGIIVALAVLAARTRVQRHLDSRAYCGVIAAALLLSVAPCLPPPA
ncbi:MAG: hypothetical protein ABJB12_20920 [Pseudomonadota bacterium]